jgi:hypothetical protein
VLNRTNTESTGGISPEHPPPISQIYTLPSPLLRESRCSTRTPPLEGQGDAPGFSDAACARLHGINTLTLCSMTCLRRMLVGPSQAPSLTCSRCACVWRWATQAHVSPCAPEKGAPSCAWLHARHLSRPAWSWDARLAWLALPAPPLSNTPCMRSRAGCCCDREPRRLRRHRQHGSLPHTPRPLSSGQRHRSATANGWAAVCVEGNALFKNYVWTLSGPEISVERAPTSSSLVDIAALSCCGTQLLSLQLPWCLRLTNLAPLAALVNLQSLNINYCNVSDLVPLAALVKLQSLNINGCGAVSDLAPLAAMGDMQSLNMFLQSRVRSVASRSHGRPAEPRHELARIRG